MYMSALHTCGLLAIFTSDSTSLILSDRALAMILKARYQTDLSEMFNPACLIDY